jgi:hypothetical protein
MLGQSLLSQAIASGLQLSRASARLGMQSHLSSSIKDAFISLRGTREQIYRAIGRSQSLYKEPG